MARTQREWHPNFIKYMEFIVDHEAYKDMPLARDEKGEIRWVVTGNSALGEKRRQWWENKREELIKLGIIDDTVKNGRYQPTALAIHPTKIKPCQTCGKELSIEYCYPKSNTLKKINAQFPDVEIDSFTTLTEIVALLLNEEDGEKFFTQYFEVPDDIVGDLIKTTEYIKENKSSSHFSPGVMSNAPDRLDGFHSYNKCCRSKEDTGRHKENLQRYGEDRRAYENWADGDWKSASWLMQVFRKHNVSPDHIGPISLGFAHRPKFQPMSREENSSKNNRMTLSDIHILLEDESHGEEIVSWHTKPLWDKIKSHIHSDDDAKNASKYLRLNMHHVLTTLAFLHINNLDDFIEQFLNPGYAFYQAEFIGFDPVTGSYKKMVRTKRDITQVHNNAKRYKAIAFRQLRKYVEKINRKTQDLPQEVLDKMLENVASAFEEGGFNLAKKELLRFFEYIAEGAAKEFIANKELSDDLLIED